MGFNHGSVIRPRRQGSLGCVYRKRMVGGALYTLSAAHSNSFGEGIIFRYKNFPPREPIPIGNWLAGWNRVLSSSGKVG